MLHCRRSGWAMLIPALLFCSGIIGLQGRRRSFRRSLLAWITARREKDRCWRIDGMGKRNYRRTSWHGFKADATAARY